MSASPHQHVGHVDALNLTVSLCLCYTLCIALTRLWIRKGAFGFDDLVVLVATLLTLSHTGSSYAALANGLGKPWIDLKDSENLSRLNASSLANLTTFILALYASKIAVLAFLARITENRSQLLGYYACSALVASFALMSILVVTIDCPSPSGYYWAFSLNTTCNSQAVRWQVLTALDLLTELTLLALPLQLVYALQMPWRKKVVLLCAFYLRAPVLALSLGRNAYTLRLTRASSDPGLDSALVTIWLEVQLAYALAASTLSALKAFTESFETGFGLGFTRGKSEGSYALSRFSNWKDSTGTTAAGVGASDTQNLTTIKYEDTTPSQHQRPLSSASSTQPLRLRPDLVTSNTNTASATVTATASTPSETNSTAPWLCGASGARSSSPTSTSSHSHSHSYREPLVIMRETELSVRREVAPERGRGRRVV